MTEVVHAGINNLPKAGDGGALLAAWVDAAVRAQAVASGYGNRFEAIRVHVPWRPLLADATGARLNPRPTAAGPQTATVVGPEEQEIHCDALGRIRICYHFQRAGHAAAAGTGDSSTWVRVLQAHAGAGMGLQFIPRIGQEVLVDFIEGDIDRPLVIAALYDGQGEGGTPPTPGGRSAASDTGVFARSDDQRPAAQGNRAAGGHAPPWHGAAAGELAAGGQRNAAALRRTEHRHAFACCHAAMAEAFVGTAYGANTLRKNGRAQETLAPLTSHLLAFYDDAKTGLRAD